MPTPFEPGSDPQSPNRNLAPVTAALDDEARLMVGGCRLSALAERYGTPLYVLDEASIRAACRAYREALQRHYPGPSLAVYASKANSSLAMTALVASEGLGLDAVSAGELLTALEGGMPPERIVLHGNNKSDEELLLAYRSGVTVVADNHHDIERLAQLVPDGGAPVRLMLRFTPGIECHTHEYIRTGHLDSKFGFDPDQLESVLRSLKGAAWAEVSGLHAHIGSQIFELDPHRDLAAVMADALRLARGLGHPVEDLNLGGGLGIRYVESDDPPSIDTWVQVVASAVAKACEERQLSLPRLLCEPGRSLVAAAGVTLYRLGSRKEVPGLRTYLSVDGGMSDNPRPITYQSLYTACLADRPQAAATETVTLAGKHCESGDVLLKDVALPASASGDVLVVLATGAYNASMSSNYNRIPRPAAVLVHDGEADLIQRRERPEDLLRYDEIPSRLSPVG
ncbi:diaminopimelate decarboxylase [Synechococcus sp. RS9909]|uniref:diaminopimelate decarboxylase n=1 Tax=unclassified Synechococcus TaxID=2626047 RepID=UPI0000690EA9|nr:MULTISPECIES: diaminopimelate decarboxylase [unclassified Synechococcus]EAQ68888.1 Diaminopimelate decarboxylase [Synechococcus sp. RS9917]QNI78972.1 diaminopimelate decarboxylase [Synechococcus sp. RS9909]